MVGTIPISSKMTPCFRLLPILLMKTLLILIHLTPQLQTRNLPRVPMMTTQKTYYGIRHLSNTTLLELLFILSHTQPLLKCPHRYTLHTRVHPQVYHSPGNGLMELQEKRLEDQTHSKKAPMITPFSTHLKRPLLLILQQLIPYTVIPAYHRYPVSLESQSHLHPPVSISLLSMICLCYSRKSYMMMVT